MSKDLVLATVDCLVAIKRCMSRQAVCWFLLHNLLWDFAVEFEPLHAEAMLGTLVTYQCCSSSSSTCSAVNDMGACSHPFFVVTLILSVSTHVTVIM